MGDSEFQRTIQELFFFFGAAGMAAFVSKVYMCVFVTKQHENVYSVDII